MNGIVGSSRYRIFLWVGAGLVVIWLAIIAGYKVADARRPTAERLAAYVQSLDLSSLSADERQAALEKLARMLNALDPESRRQARMGRKWDELFAGMTDSEKLTFVEATLPTGVKQMLDAFEELSEDKRERAVNDALRRMRETRAEVQAAGGGGAGPTNEPIMSEAIGMKTFYSQSSAQTKAELAPVIEEMQRLMESGRLFRERRQ